MDNLKQSVDDMFTSAQETKSIDIESFKEGVEKLFQKNQKVDDFKEQQFDRWFKSEVGSIQFLISNLKSTRKDIAISMLELLSNTIFFMDKIGLSENEIRKAAFPGVKAVLDILDLTIGINASAEYIKKHPDLQEMFDSIDNGKSATFKEVAFILGIAHMQIIGYIGNNYGPLAAITVSEPTRISYLTAAFFLYPLVAIAIKEEL